MTGLTKSSRLRFREFAADLDAGELFQHGVKAVPQEKAFPFLVVLAARPKQLLSRQDIIHAVWSDTLYEEIGRNIAAALLPGSEIHKENAYAA